MVLRPPALRPGDLVMLVSPSGPTRPERVARGIELLTHWGLRVETAPNAYARHGYLAGTDAQRLADLNAALREEVRGVLTTRGATGCSASSTALDLDAVRRRPEGRRRLLRHHRPAAGAVARGPARHRARPRCGVAGRADRARVGRVVAPGRDDHGSGRDRGPAGRGDRTGTAERGAPGRGGSPARRQPVPARRLGRHPGPARTARVRCCCWRRSAEPPYKVDRMWCTFAAAGVGRGHGGSGRPVHRVRRRVDDDHCGRAVGASRARSACRCSAGCRSGTAATSSPSRSAYRRPSTCTPEP